jgi:hypothetical protein
LKADIAGRLHIVEWIDSHSTHYDDNKHN